MVQPVHLQVRDRDGHLLVSKMHPASVTEFSELYVVLPAGRFSLKATTESGWVAERELVVDPARPARRALVLQLAKR